VKVNWRIPKAVVAIFLGMLILSRHITGAPGADMELFRSLVGSETVEKSMERTNLLLIDPRQENCASSKTIMSHKSNEQNKNSYKKYVSTEKFTSYREIQQIATQNYQSTSFTQFWIFSTLPQVIHSNDPPRNRAIDLYFFNSPINIGDRDYLYETQSCSYNRGVCINCVRP
jgi:hypothetical protein